jgi:hypothetical protein
MVTPISKRDRDDPESALLHQFEAPHHQDKGDPWPWPSSADRELQAEREAKATGGQIPAPHAEAIDRAAYDRFMRSLG